MFKLTVFALAAFVGGNTGVLAQATHDHTEMTAQGTVMDHGAMDGSTMDHSAMDHTAMSDNQADGPLKVETVLTEPGQGAFAALSEVVQLLEADPDTDWATVDLDGLRAHLVDMDRLVSDTIATQTDLPNGITVLASGDAETLATLRRMVPAHAAQLASDPRWNVDAEDTGDAIQLTVTSDDPATVARIRGLGFFGLMASQDHHRAHHLMMALGEHPHG